jgi:hypothetical protein
MDMEAEIRELQRQMKGIPSRFAGGGSVAPTPSYPWVQLLAVGGQTLITSAPKSYGIKRKVGEAKPTHWIYSPIRATATCSLSLGAVSTVSMTNIGQGYTTAPVVTVSAPPGGGTQAVLTPTVADGGSVAGVYITACGTLYGAVTGTPPLVTFSAPPSGVTATGSAFIRDGKVVGVTVTNAGSGYVTAPTVTIDASDGGGTLATATAVVRKGKISLAITTAGSGYVATPTITIAAPPDAPSPAPPNIADDSPAQWADGIGWGRIQGGSLSGGLATTQPVLICHDDRSLVPYGIMGEGGNAPLSRPADSILTWYRTLVKLTIADADADGVLEAWVPMAGGA